MAVSAGLGLDRFPFEDYRQFWRWVALCDEGGVDSIWQSDRLISSEPHLECMSTMAALAGGSRRVKFGMNVASMALRDPVLTAKACATIDVLSGGRLLPAFGIGLMSSPDFTRTGTPAGSRGRLTDERLEIISRLWSQESVTFQGQHHQLTDASICPRPLQQPLPLWVGGSSSAAIERTARWGTGWQAGLETPAQVAQVISSIKQQLVKWGRRIDEDHYGAGFAFRLGRADDAVVRTYRDSLIARLGTDPGNLVICGAPETIMAHIRAYREAGVHKFVLRPVAADGEDFLRQTQLFIDQIQPRVAELNR